ARVNNFETTVPQAVYRLHQTVRTQLLSVLPQQPGKYGHHVLSPVADRKQLSARLFLTHNTVTSEKVDRILDGPLRKCNRGKSRIGRHKVINGSIQIGV